MANRTIELTLKSNVQGMVNGVKTAQKAATDAGRSLDDFRRQNEQAWNTVGTTLATAGTAISAGVGASVKAAMDWESAWAGVQKTNDGTEQQMQALEEDLRNLATTLPATHTEIAAVAEAAGQLGVGVDDVSEFTETMINLGETTNLSADEAATALARFSNITGTSFSDVDKLGSSLVDLGNNFATTESEILEMSERVAAAGTQAGLTDGEIMGLATAMSSVGIEAQAGGTAMTQTFNEIDTAVREGGDSLEGWAELAGVSAQEFSNAWQEDPATAITMMVEGLGEVASQGGDVNGTLEDLGINGIRQADTLRRLAGASDLVGEAFETGNEAFAENSALAEEAALRYETVEAKISVAWNNIKDAAITAGEVILPAVGGIADAVGGAASAFSDLPPAVSGSITVLSGVAGVSAAALGGLMLLVPKAVETASAFKTIWDYGPRTRGAIKGVGTAAGLAVGGLVALQAASALFGESLDGIATAQQMSPVLKGFGDDSETAGRQLDELSQISLGAGGNIEGLQNAMDVIDTGGFERAWKSPLGAMGLMNDELDASQALFSNLDTAVSGLMSSGDIDAVASTMQHVADSAKETQTPLQDWIGEFPQLEASLREAGIEMDEFLVAIGASKGIYDETTGTYQEMDISLEDLKNRLSESEQEARDAAAGAAEFDGALEEMGISADGAVESLTDYLDMLFQTGLRTMDVNESQRRYQESLNGVLDSVKQITDPESGLGGMEAALNKAGDGFDHTTEAGILAGRAFEDVARAGFDSATAMAEADASQDEIQASLQGTYEDLIKAADKFGITGDEAEELARSVLGIEDDVSIETWMSEQAKASAEELNRELTEAERERIATILAEADTGLAVEDLTSAAQDRIAEILADPESTNAEGELNETARQRIADILADSDTWSAEGDLNDTARDRIADIFADPDSWTAEGELNDTARQRIADILADPSTWNAESDLNNTSRDRTANINASASTWSAESALNSVARTRTAFINVATAGGGAGAGLGGLFSTGGANGGRVGRDFGFPRLATGGRLPYTGLGTDQILGLSSGGRPTALVDDGEWVIRERSADKYNSVLDRINRDHPSVQHLAGYANGGRAASSAVAAANSSPGLDVRELAAAMAGAGGGGGVSIGEITAVGGDTQQVVNRVGDEIFRRLRQEGVPVGSF